MTLLSVIKDVCAVVGVTIPQSSVFTNITSNRTMTEMVALANEMAQRIAYDTREWTLLKKTKVMTGNGVLAGFDLPTDFRRMLLTSNVWRSTSALYPMRFIADTDEWLQRRALNHYSPVGEWTLLGSQMLIQPVMGSGVTAYFAYLHENCVMLASGGAGSAFVADNDSFALDERVLKLGMIWQWKANKGSPYAEDMASYSDALAMVAGADKPAPIIIGRLPISVAISTIPSSSVPTVP